MHIKHKIEYITKDGIITYKDFDDLGTLGDFLINLTLFEDCGDDKELQQFLKRTADYEELKQVDTSTLKISN